MKVLMGEEEEEEEETDNRVAEKGN